MKHRSLGKFLIAAASISMAVSPITAFAKDAAPVLYEGEATATVDTKALLNDAIDYAEKADTTNVVPKVVSNLNAKLGDAKKVSAKDGATTEEIKAAWSDLVDAVHYLDFKGDVTSLNTLINEVKDNKAEDYTEGWEDFAKALADAQAVAGDKNALQADIDAAKAALNTAIAGLKAKTPEVVDKTDLKAAIADAKAKNADDYTADSWAVVADALKAAEAVDADEDATQAAVNAAKADLETAVAGLKEKEEPVTPPAKVDKTALNKAIADAKAKKQADYTTDSWTPLADALKAGEAVAAKADATQGEVTEAANKILNAINALKKVETQTPATVDKKPLFNVLDTHKSLNAKAPTGDASLNEDSYKAFKDVYAKSQAVYDKTDATQKEVDDATAALKAAHADLEQNVYRVYNPNNGEHLFTTNKEEYDALGKIGWKQENVAWIAPYKTEKGWTMTRMYEPQRGEHHYTRDPEEIKALEKLGWNNEGEKWNSATKNANVIHRMYNPNETRAGAHHYTLEDGERDDLQKFGWKYEHNDEVLIYAKKSVKR